MVLSMVGCGTEPTTGFTVDTKEYTLPVGGIEQAIKLTQNAYNQKFDNNLDLLQLLQDSKVNVVYKPDVYDDVNQVRGLTTFFSWGINVQIQYQPTCLGNVYILAHEMMHVIAGEYMGVDRQDNHDHRVDGLFVQKVGDDSVEMTVYMQVEMWCP